MNSQLAIRNPHWQSAFTLTELRGVIAIIAVPASLLRPANLPRTRFGSSMQTLPWRVRKPTVHLPARLKYWESLSIVYQ